MSISNKFIVILGPTASGKSKMALKLAKKFNGEIVNADSRQIYKEMDIGTDSPISCHPELVSGSAKTTGLTNSIFPKSSADKMETTYNFKQQAFEINSRQTIKRQKILKQVQNDRSVSTDKVPHHLYHIISPDQKFSLAQYKKLAIKKIRDIQKRGKLPILVGGTGLYISAVVDNLKIPKAPPSKKIREELEKKSARCLFNRLKKIDPKSAKIIGPYNKRKLIRALEVYKITGKSFSDQQVKGKPLFDTLQIGIKIDRGKLYKKIDRRVNEMIKNGLVEETEKLSKKYSFDLPAMSGIGYKEISSYLKNKDAMESAAQKIKFRTHQYARRQMTWFRRDKRIRWVGSYKKAKRLVSDFLNRK